MKSFTKDGDTFYTSDVVGQFRKIATELQVALQLRILGLRAQGSQWVLGLIGHRGLRVIQYSAYPSESFLEGASAWGRIEKCLIYRVVSCQRNLGY